MRISDWSSDVCSSDLALFGDAARDGGRLEISERRRVNRTEREKVVGNASVGGSCQNRTADRRAGVRIGNDVKSPTDALDREVVARNARVGDAAELVVGVVGPGRAQITADKIGRAHV